MPYEDVTDEGFITDQDVTTDEGFAPLPVKVRPTKPKKPLKKTPQRPIKPIKITDEMREATVAAVEQEYARRLLIEQKRQEEEQTKLNTLRVFGTGGLPGMGLERVVGESQQDLNLQAASTDAKVREVIKANRPRAIRRAAQGKKITPFEEQLVQMPEEMELPPMPDTTVLPPSRWRSDINAFLQPLAQMGPMTVEGVMEFIDFVGGSDDPGRLAPSVKRATGTASSFLRGALPVDPQYSESKFLGGLGSAAGFVAGGAGARALKIPSLVSTAIMGAGVNISDVLREADMMGIDPKRRDASLLLAAATGLTEMAGVGRIIKNYGLERSFVRRLFEVAEEGGQEGLQTWLNNINAAIVGGYDPDRPLSKDIIESAIIGAGVGGVVQGTSAGLERMKRNREDQRVMEADVRQVGVLPGGFFSPPRIVDGAVPPTVALSERALTPSEMADDFSFDLLPGLRPGQAPVMISPGWVLEAVVGKPVDGVNIPLKEIPSIRNSLIAKSPSKRHLSEALFQINEAVMASKAEGLNTVSLVQRGTDLSKVIPHETFHAGQAQIGGTVFDVHDSVWARNNPIIQELISRNPSIRNIIATPDNQRATEDILAAELPTYVVAGQGGFYFDSYTTEVDFLYEYLGHVTEKHGTRALDILERVAKLPPESQEIFQSFRSTYESYERERELAKTTQPGGAYEGRGRQVDLTGGIPEVAERGAGTRGDQEEIERTPPAASRGPAPWYYFNFARAIDDPKLPPKMTLDQVEAMFKPGGRYATKKDEWEWTIKPFLEGKRERGETRVTKDELRQLAEASLPRVEEVVKGGGGSEELIRRKDQWDQAQITLDNAIRIRDQWKEAHDSALATVRAYQGVEVPLDLMVSLRKAETEYEQSKLAVQRSENYLQQAINDYDNMRDMVERGLLEGEDTDAMTPWSSIRAVPGGIPGTYKVVAITLPNVSGKYTSHAFDEPNIVVWVRFNEHLDKDGNRVLTIQEIQSDWHQQGRERGYVSSSKKAQMEDELGVLQATENELAVKIHDIGEQLGFRGERTAHPGTHLFNVSIHHSMAGDHFRRRVTEAAPELVEEWGTTISQIDRLERDLNRMQASSIPDAPFKDTWHELAFKRMVRWAADKGIDRIAWSTGLQQIRVNENTLRREVDRMELKRYESQDTKEAEELLNKLNAAQVKYTNAKDEWEATNDPNLEESVVDLRMERDDLLHKYSEKFSAPKFQGGFTRPYIAFISDPAGKFTAYKDGRILIDQDVDQEWLDKYIEPAIQKELFEKGQLDTGSYTIGGKFHKLLYDDKLTQVAKEIGKKSGGKVEDVEVVTATLDINKPQPNDVLSIRDLPNGDIEITRRDGEVFTTGANARSFWEATLKDSMRGIEKVHSLTIPTQLAQRAQYEGFPLATEEPPEGFKKAGSIQVGDKVRSKSRGLTGKVTKVGTDEDGPWAEVTFGENNVEELYLNDLTRVTKVTQHGLEEGLGGAGKAIGENFRRALKESIEKTGYLPSTEKGSALWKKYESLVLGGAPRDVTTLDAAILQVTPSTEPTTAPPTKVAVVGDKVKVKDTTEPVEVQYRATDGILVKLPDGSVKAIEFKDIEEVVEKAPTRSPSTRPQKTLRQKALEEVPIVEEAMPNQPSLPGIEAPKRLIAAPELPQPAQPDLPGIEEDPILFKRTVTPEVRKAVIDGFTALLETGGIRPAPGERIHLQVRRAILEGKIDPRKFANLLNENNLSVEDFVGELDLTITEAAKTLNELSRPAKLIYKFMQENPTLAKKVIPAKERMEAILAEIDASVVGKNLLYRASDVLRGLILTDLFITIRNIGTTLRRIPIMGGTQSLAAWIETVHSGSQHGTNLADQIAKANQRAMENFEPVAQVIAHMTPPQLRKFFKLTEGKGSGAQYEEAVTALRNSFPDLHHELAVPGFATERRGTYKEAEKLVEIAEETLKEMRVDVKNRDEMVRRFRKAEARLHGVRGGLGKALRAPEYAIEKLLHPMNLSEKFFRDPVFYGHLYAKLKARDWDLADAIKYERMEDSYLTEDQKAKRFRNIPEEDFKAAIDEALYFTHAYSPRVENGPGERFARDIIVTLNKWRPVAPITNTWFARAMYNGLKFTYEYVPLLPLMGAVPIVGPVASALAIPFGMIGPTYRIISQETVTDPKTGEKVKKSPIRSTDYKRLAAGIIGTVMYAVARSFLEAGGGGDEEEQVKTPLKGRKGEPVHLDIRGDMPVAGWIRIAALTKRFEEGRVTDVEFSKELTEILTGMQKAGPEFGESVDALMQMWSGDEPLDERVGTYAGRRFSMFTQPFVNVRNALAIFDEEENKRKDLKGTGFWGPSIDKLPYFRRSLPDLVSPTQEGPVLSSEYPAAQWFPGIKLVESESFADREWKRLGLYTNRFLQPSANPAVNRAQNESFSRGIRNIGKMFEGSAFYESKDDVGKAGLWEHYIRGNELAEEAIERGMNADPIYRRQEEMKRESEMGPLERKSSGLEQRIRELKNTPTPPVPPR